MIQNIKKISDLLKIEDQKLGFDKDVFDIIDILKQDFNISINKNNIFIKNNIVKIKTISNIRFLVLLNLKNINYKIKAINKLFILEL